MIEVKEKNRQKTYYLSFVYLDGQIWNYGSTTTQVEAMTEEQLKKEEKEIGEQLGVKHVAFLLIKELDE